MQERGFFGALFDVSFTSFVTTRIIKVSYVITLVLIGVGVVFFVAASFSQGAGQGIAVLIFAPLIALLYVIYARMLLELVIAIFRIMEFNGEQVALLRAQAGGAPPAASPTSPPQGPPFG